MIDIDEIQSSPYLLDTLLQVEDVLDSLDLYVFANWLDGTIIEGPNLKRYWVNITISYPYKKLPDPTAIPRLLKHGIRVDIKKGRFESEDECEDGYRNLEDNEEIDEEDIIWLIKVSIPRRLITDMNSAQLDFYEDEIDVDDVQDAQDSGLTDTSQYMKDEEDDDFDFNLGDEEDEQQQR